MFKESDYIRNVKPASHYQITEVDVQNQILKFDYKRIANGNWEFSFMLIHRASNIRTIELKHAWLFEITDNSILDNKEWLSYFFTNLFVNSIDFFNAKRRHGFIIECDRNRTANQIRMFIENRNN